MDKRERIKDVAEKIEKGALNIGDVATDVVAGLQDGSLVEKALKNAMLVPGVKIDREKYLRKNLSRYFNSGIVEKAIEYNPAYAGINKHEIEKIAFSTIKYETSRATTVSAGASAVPNGFAAVLTDLTSFFAFMLRAMQKLAYLYGYDDFNLKNSDEIDDETMNQVMMFIGSMFGVEQAGRAILQFGDHMVPVIAKKIAAQPLTKGTIYPIIKDVMSKVGVKLTKQIFADGIANTIPVLSIVLSGGLTYGMFRKCCINLKSVLEKSKLCDPKTYLD